MKKLLLVLAFSLVASAAHAVCPQIPLNIKDASLNTVPMSSASAADGNCKTYIDADTSSQLHTDLTASIPAGTNRIGYTTDDPCAQLTKTNVSISMQNATTIKLVSLVSGKQIYVCSLALIASGTTTFSIADGTKVTTECDTSAEAVIGNTTSSHGLALVANAGLSFGNGHGTVARTTTASHDLCLFQSGAVDLSGVLTYVQQ